MTRPPHACVNGRRVLDEDLAPLVIAAFKAGKTISEIKRELRIHPRRINRILDANGVDHSPAVMSARVSAALSAYRADPGVKARYTKPQPQRQSAGWREDLLIDERDRWILTEYRTACRSSSGYRAVRVFCKATGKATALARFILGAKPGEVVDHINGNPLDNRRANLRLCTAQENGWNRAKQASRSKFKGVTFSNGRWAAQIQADGQKRHLGKHDREIDAALAYDRAARELHGEFARLNFPEREAA